MIKRFALLSRIKDAVKKLPIFTPPPPVVEKVPATEHYKVDFQPRGWRTPMRKSGKRHTIKYLTSSSKHERHLRRVKKLQRRTS